jgi:hypothetical protein
LLAFALLAAGTALAEPRFSFQATPGKLPKDVVPAHYSLRWCRICEGSLRRARRDRDRRRETCQARDAERGEPHVQLGVLLTGTDETARRRQTLPTRP